MKPCPVLFPNQTKKQSTDTSINFLKINRIEKTNLFYNISAFYVHTTEISDTDNATIASLESEPFHTDTTLSGYICFKFWYHMFGKHVKKLTVSVGDSQKFVESGDQSQVWHCGVINVTGLSGKVNRKKLPRI